ncbi:TVP38/TMEM64 family protein [Roseomonas marmotae]|uniref:TVP38/TMEM64 family membrane protein n=1 Tax=Roseomonas marmotae TaxID=2768161 RepID=A0ABS3K6N9_9PROT|nr:VTT domain-containing protein [Roseomonas marmotae]MBO1073118.1 TVP38/TMEM64 family protein [Roseomonas marmotae]QTI79244.1 TVP38/TMEM64 family protein [Roseomonas marmotae]
MSLPSRLGPVGRVVLLAAGLGLGGWLLRELGGGAPEAWVERFGLHRTLWGESVFFLLGALACAVGVPRQAVAFLGGYAFGAWTGTGLSLLAQLLGAAFSFGWAAAIGRDWAERRLTGRMGRRLRGLRDVLAASPFNAALALRLLPVGNNLALNLLAGLSGIPALAFLAGSAVGYLPQTVIFALVGSGVAVDRQWQIGLAAGLFVVSAVLGFWMLRRHRAGQAMQDETRQDEPAA